jgi:hypothetical protein
VFALLNGKWRLPAGTGLQAADAIVRRRFLAPGRDATLPAAPS